MSENFSAKDEARLNGAKGNLEEAVVIVRDALRYGNCPLSEALIKEARKLSDSASVLLGRIGVK